MPVRRLGLMGAGGAGRVADAVESGFQGIRTGRCTRMVVLMVFRVTQARCGPEMSDSFAGRLACTEMLAAFWCVSEPVGRQAAK